MKKRYVFLLIFLLTGMVMFFSNPKEQTHRDAVSKEIMSALSEEKDQIEQKGNLAGVMMNNLNDDVFKLMVTPMVKNAVIREDYVVFSLTRLKLGAIDRRVGIGLFGKVFIAPQVKTTIKDNIQQYFK
ncbi:hypothetical protein DBR32_02145 [Taibaiella sp. KBW10]|uniref:DUF4359 domain-containing protein n=1 Tax=Taibaiella sp. KBW10 TaxID=2153357 RepID=UPI000F5AFAA9|nr:DUF4359 domain-containing protein [Taibaiella sp. KBW10]RQO32428.1 hypothetical protein DBR32_02145 [Taibaiella sp. KBW10]